jgi:hypothetical protein
MAFQAPASPGASGHLVPIDSYVGILVALIDLGTHEDVFKDKKTQEERRSWLRRILFVWELTGLRHPEGRYGPTMTKEYNLVTTPGGSYRKLLEKMRGKPYAVGEAINPEEFFGKPFLLKVGHKESQASSKVYARIEEVGTVPSIMPVVPSLLPPVAWEIGSGPYPSAPWVPTHLYGEPIKDVVARSREMSSADGPTEASGGGESQEVPF